MEEMKLYIECEGSKPSRKTFLAQKFDTYSRIVPSFKKHLHVAKGQLGNCTSTFLAIQGNLYVNITL
jgi:hypothetical protein